MAMPFSALPTAFRVVVGERSVWANCAWDAFGIAAALERGRVVRHALSGVGPRDCRRRAARRGLRARRRRWPTSACRPRGGGTTSASPDRRFGSSGRKRTSRRGNRTQGREPGAVVPVAQLAALAGDGIAAGWRPTGSPAARRPRRRCLESTGFTGAVLVAGGLAFRPRRWRVSCVAGRVAHEARARGAALLHPRGQQRHAPRRPAPRCRSAASGSTAGATLPACTSALEFRAPGLHHARRALGRSGHDPVARLSTVVAMASGVQRAGASSVYFRNSPSDAIELCRLWQLPQLVER